MEYSSNNGQNWQTAWQFPPARRPFLNKSIRTKLKQIGPFDLAFAPDNSGTLIVTMGADGILIMGSEGNWIRQPVNLPEKRRFIDATPSPYQTSDISTIIEVLLPYEISFLVFLH